VPWSPVGQGFLTGAVGRGESFSENDIRSRFPRFTPEALEANQPIVELVGEAAEVALTVAEVEEIDALSAHLTVIGDRGSSHMIEQPFYFVRGLP
jgi:aryl-alcohol dehydrogenase-like predicted oxidoreductase